MRGVYGREGERVELNYILTFLSSDPRSLKGQLIQRVCALQKRSLIKLVFRRINLCNTSAGFLQRNSKKHHSPAEWMKADAGRCEPPLWRNIGTVRCIGCHSGSRNRRHRCIYATCQDLQLPMDFSFSLLYSDVSLYIFFKIQAFHAISSRLYSLMFPSIFSHLDGFSELLQFRGSLVCTLNSREASVVLVGYVTECGENSKNAARDKSVCISPAVTLVVTCNF